MQVYNLPTAPQAGTPSVTAVCHVVNLDGGSFYETLDDLPAGAPVTYERMLPPEKFTPGNYAVTVTVRDSASQQSTSATAKFAIQ
jgi:hypothetical protein